jgi:hypothetical protein
MKRFTILAPSLLLQAVLVGGAAYAQDGPPPQPGYQQGGNWDAPPADFNDNLHRRAFHDGIQAARKDFEAQRPPDPASHMEFRHPLAPPPARDTYREAFKRGYFMATEHLRGGHGEHGPEAGGPPLGAGFAQGGWDAPPSEFQDDLRRRAFHDGIEAARHDFEGHRPFDPASHEEFRHPQVPRPSQDTYREAYRRGYMNAVQHMQGGPR